LFLQLIVLSTKSCFGYSDVFNAVFNWANLLKLLKPDFEILRHQASIPSKVRPLMPPAAGTCRCNKLATLPATGAKRVAK